MLNHGVPSQQLCPIIDLSTKVAAVTAADLPCPRRRVGFRLVEPGPGAENCEAVGMHTGVELARL